MKYGYTTTDGTTYQLLLEKAKKMRNNPTEAESLLWQYLRRNGLKEHFRQQHPICGYIPDFVCLRLRLIIEIDGGYHSEGEQQEQDKIRQDYLEKEGFSFLRFTNEEVLYDTDETIGIIKDTIEELKREAFQNTRQAAYPPLGRDRVGSVRVGFGFDVHKLVEGRDLWLGGIKIPHSLGLLGHSDADVLIHAICDALLGAANMRDIGYHFPDTSADTLDIDSKILLKKTIDLIATKGYRLGNIDATVCAERPKINPHVEKMKECLATVMNADVDDISIKATTTEKLGFTGREEGISAYATVLIYKD
jgi:2-C-methyl-D-erythritol 2,4-cyclodiphosphate synthase